MSEKLIYAQFIQENIRRYGWQSFTTKMAAVLIALVFLALGMTSPTALSLASGASLWSACGVVLCFLLWCGDGYSADMADRYNTLYEKAVAEGGDMKMKVDSGALKIKSVWRPSVIAFHAPIMAMLVLLGLAAK